VTWPTGPPPMPTPGWYDDPEQAWTWRYWDGAQWTGHRAPMWVPPIRDPTSFSAWFEGAVAVAKVAVRRVGALLGAIWLLLGIAGLWLVFATFGSDRGRELRRLLVVDDDPLSPSGAWLADDLTDAEAERAWELTQDMFWSALPWLIALTVAFVVAAAWSVALVARAVGGDVRRQESGQGGVGDQRPADPPADGLGSVMAGAARRVPAVIGSGIVVFATFGVVWVAASIPIVAVAVADAGTVAIVLTTVFVVLLVIVVSAWLWGRLTLASVIAATGGHGLGVRRSWNITHGRFWFVVGRLVVTGLIAGAAGGVVNFFTGFGQFLGAVVFLTIVALLQSLAVAVSMIATTCGHLATIDQLDRSDVAGSSHGPPVA
jgi:hypothetical protein